MKFFVPLVDHAVEAEIVRSEVRDRLRERGMPTTPRRIRALTPEDGPGSPRLEIGKEAPATGELVMLILEASDAEAYYICTPHRGVLRGTPYTTGLGERGRAIDFDRDHIDRLWGPYLR